MSPTGYSLASYGSMITCEPRMSANIKALRSAVKPGCTVIDIGAGPGVFALLACQFGAGSVIAIEPHPSVELLRQMAVDNGFDDRIEIFRGLSTDYQPNARADVIISDLRGHLPLFEQHIPTIVDARERLLEPGGAMIPMRDTIRIALVNSPSSYVPCEEPWLQNNFALNLSEGNRFARNDFTKLNLDVSALLSSPADLAIIDYRFVTEPSISGEADLIAEVGGNAHGLLLWFDAELAPGIGFSNAPGQPEQVYSQTFFPFERPIDLAPGDTVAARIRADLVEGDYVWSWISKIWRNGAVPAELEFRQSTFLGRILSPNRLARRSSSFITEVSDDREIDLHCLAQLDGKTSLGEIAKAVMEAFPNRFKSGVEALTHVSNLAARYRKNSPPTSAGHDRQ